MSALLAPLLTVLLATTTGPAARADHRASVDSPTVKLTIDQVKSRLAAGGGDNPPDLSRSDLSGLDLHGLDFRRANLTGARLAGAKLAGANLFSCDLT